MALTHEDRRKLTASMSPEEVRELGIEGLMLLDLRLCRRDSEVTARDKNLPGIVSWLPEGTERDWLRAWLDTGQRDDRIEGMEELAAAGEWHDLSCQLSGWHDDLAAMQLIYARWDADAPRRNASKPRRKTTEPGVSWQRELVAHLREHGPKTKLAKFRSLPRKRSHDEDGPCEEALSLLNGKWQVYRDPDGRIVCVEDETGEISSISYATFEDYLKPAPKRR